MGIEQCQRVFVQQQKANVNAHVQKATFCFYVLIWAAAGQLFGEDVSGSQDSIGHAGEAGTGMVFWRGMKGVPSPGSSG